MAGSAAFVLAGGASSRLGRDKARLRLPGGGTLLEHTLALCSEACEAVALVAPRERYADLGWAGPVVEDLYPGKGPLAGIHAALHQTRAELNLVVAVDMPSLSGGLLRFLLAQAAANTAAVTVPLAGGRQHPLCAVYRRSFAAAAEKALQEGNNAIRAALDAVSVKLVSEQELEAAGFSAAMFCNLNTPADYEELVR